MATRRSCKACSDLQENAADFVMNGVTDAVASSLENNTGFNPSSGNNDCTDLNDANDCLIGNMEDEVDAQDVCNWKPFMTDFIHNLWNVLKAIITAICGLWTYAETHDCQIDALMNGQEFEVGEESTDGSYVAAGKGVSFLGTGTEAGKTQVSLEYIAGGLCRVTGTLIMYKENFTDDRECTNFDNGSVERVSSSRKGNTELNNTYTETHDDVDLHMVRRMVGGGELLYEIRINKEHFPMIKSLRAGLGMATGGGEYHVKFQAFNEGEYAYGQHGDCNRTTGVPNNVGNDDGHLVPEGWIYVQCRMVSITFLRGNVAGGDPLYKYSPAGYMGIRLNSDSIDCDALVPDDEEPEE